jgi:hypothetical protein
MLKRGHIFGVVWMSLLFILTFGMTIIINKIEKMLFCEVENRCVWILADHPFIIAIKM